MICSNCYIQMTEVMSFTRDKHESFIVAKKCNQETKHKKMKNDKLDFGEVLKSKLHNK